MSDNMKDLLAILFLIVVAASVTIGIYTAGYQNGLDDAAETQPEVTPSACVIYPAKKCFSTKDKMVCQS